MKVQKSGNAAVGDRFLCLDDTEAIDWLLGLGMIFMRLSFCFLFLYRVLEFGRS